MSTSSRPVFIGMNNPVSQSDGHELYPYPPGCTGWRLLEMLRTRLPAVGRRDYLEAFERRNLVVAAAWSRELGRASAARMYAEFWGGGRTVVLLGREVQAAFGIPPLLVHPQLIGGTTWRQIPHPSGRNPFYNDVKSRDTVALLLEELYIASIKGE
jgi:hypothetical protein